MKVLETGDGRSSKFSGYGAAIKERGVAGWGGGLARRNMLFLWKGREEMKQMEEWRFGGHGGHEEQPRVTEGNGMEIIFVAVCLDCGWERQEFGLLILQKLP